MFVSISIRWGNTMIDDLVDNNIDTKHKIFSESEPTT